MSNTSAKFYGIKRVTGIGPATTAWKAVVLPLNYTRVNGPCWARTNDRTVMSRLL